MKLKSLTKLAAVSAVALSAALYAGVGDAANEIGTPQTITLGATLENDLTIVKTSGTLVFSATPDLVDTATGSINATTGVTTSDPGTGIFAGSLNPASLVFDTGGGVQIRPQMVLTPPGGAAFTGDSYFVGIDPTPGSVVDLDCGNANIAITGITDNQATPLAWVLAPPSSAAGVSAWTAGAQTIKFGVSLTTGIGASNDYNAVCTGGTFNVVIDY